MCYFTFSLRRAGLILIGGGCGCADLWLVLWRRGGCVRLYRVQGLTLGLRLLPFDLLIRDNLKSPKLGHAELEDGKTETWDHLMKSWFIYSPPKQNLFNIFHRLSPLKFNVNVFILPFSKHGIFLFLCFFLHRHKHGQDRKLISHPDITAWKCRNAVLPIQSTHHVKLSSLGGAVTGWSVSHSHSSKIPNLQGKTHQCSKSVTLTQQTLYVTEVGGGVSYAVTGACVCLDPQTARNSHPQFPTRTCKQHWPTSPLGGDCVAACRRHRALRSQTKQSIIMLFYWTGNKEIHAQMAPLRWTFITIIDKKEERCLNCDLTT